MKKIFAYILISVFVLNASHLLAQNEINKNVDTYLITNATIHTPDSVLTNASIYIEKGVIKEIASTIVAPKVVSEIDLQERDLYPGFINAFSDLGIKESETIPQVNDPGEKDNYNPNINPRNAINLDSPYITAAFANGVLFNVSTATHGDIPGKATLFATNAWNWDLANKKEDVSMVLNFSTGIGSWNPSALSAEAHLSGLGKIDEFINDCKRYYKAFKANQSESKLFKRSVYYEAMFPVLEKKLPVWIVARSVVEIQSAINFGKRYDFKIVIVGGDDADLMARQLIENDIPVVVNNIIGLPIRGEKAYDHYYSIPYKLYQKGIRFCIAVSSSMNVRNLNFTAGMSTAFGLPVDKAIDAITIDAAKIIGVDKEYGSIEVGKKANLIVTNGNPLDYSSPIEMIFMDGIQLEVTSRHKKLYEQYQKRYEE